MAVASYTYDYGGRRVSKTVYGSPNVTTKYCYDGGQVIAEYDGSDILLRKFIYGPGIDEPICMVDVADSNAGYYYHFDGLGSVVALSDVNNVIVESYSYDVFGAPTIYDANYTEISPSAIGNPYMFTARRADDETALYYYRARYYAFDIGRFLQSDPLGYADGLNRYNYCGNNASGYVDPFGTFSIYAEGGVIYEPSPNGFGRISPPSALQQKQIDKVIQGMNSTGEPVFEQIAQSLEGRNIYVDCYLTNSKTAGWVDKGTKPNNIYLSPDIFNDINRGVKSGEVASYSVFTTLVHEDLHLVSRYDYSGGDFTWMDAFWQGLLYNDGLDTLYHKVTTPTSTVLQQILVAEKYAGELWNRYSDIMQERGERAKDGGKPK